MIKPSQTVPECCIKPSAITQEHSLIMQTWKMVRASFFFLIHQFIYLLHCDSSCAFLVANIIWDRNGLSGNAPINRDPFFIHIICYNLRRVTVLWSSQSWGGRGLSRRVTQVNRNACDSLKLKRASKDWRRPPGRCSSNMCLHLPQIIHWFLTTPTMHISQCPSSSLTESNSSVSNSSTVHFLKCDLFVFKWYFSKCIYMGGLSESCLVHKLISSAQTWI